MHRRPLAAIVAVAIGFVGGCGFGSEQQAAVAEHCSGTFDMDSLAEPLGSSVDFLTTGRKRSAQPGALTLGELTASSGWSDTWDKMIVVLEGTTREQMNAATGLTDYCWPNLPEFNWDSPGHDEFYVFFQGTKPKQTVLTQTSHTLFDGAPNGAKLRPNTRLEPVAPDIGEYGHFNVVA